jgi:gluconolactonase
MPEQTANLAWGDADLHGLYLTATTSVYRLHTRAVGYSVL